MLQETWNHPDEESDTKQYESIDMTSYVEGYSSADDVRIADWLLVNMLLLLVCEMNFIDHLTIVFIQIFHLMSHTN